MSKQIKTSPHRPKSGREREDGLEGQAMETKRAYVTAAGLCVNVASSQEAICRDNDKILTLELRKCSERRTNGRGNDGEERMGNTSSVSFIGQSCRPKSSPRIPSRPYTVRCKTCRSVARRNSPLTSLLIASLICKAASAIWLRQNLLLQLHQNRMWSSLVLSFCVDGDSFVSFNGFFCVSFGENVTEQQFLCVLVGMCARTSPPS